MMNDAIQEQPAAMMMRLNMNDEELPQFRESPHMPQHAGIPPAKMMPQDDPAVMKMMMKPPTVLPLNRDDSSSSTADSTVESSSESAVRSSFGSNIGSVRVTEDGRDGNWLCQLQYRLYSREEEEAILLRSYQHNLRSSSSFRGSNSNGSGELCLISGAAGLGKSSLAKTLALPVQEENGYFLTGKFDQVKQAGPNRIFADAFAEFTNAVLAKGPDMVEAVRHDIREALGDELGVLLSGIPALEQIVGKPDGGPVQFSCQMVKRFVFALHDLIGAVCRRGPMVLLFDDLQFSDQCSLKLLKWFMTGPHHNRLFIVGTCDDSVSPSSPVSTMLRELEDENQKQIFHIEVSQKPCSAIWDIMRETISFESEDRYGVLAKLVCAQTHGNPLYILEFLRWLWDERLLQYDAVKGTFILHNDDARLTAKCICLGDFLIDVLKQLPTDVQEVLRVAACFGNDINEGLLRVVFPPDTVADHLHDATSRGVLIFDQEGYSFRHDGLQKAAQSLIPIQEKELLHLRLGRKLLKGLSEKDRETHMYLILGQLRLGRNLIQERGEKVAVAMLCLKAGQASARASAFGAAAGYFEFGIDMMDKSWEGDYSLKLALYNAAAEMELTISNYERVHELVQEVLGNVKSLKHRIQAYNTLIYSYGVTDQQHLAVDTGISVLAELGETFPVKNCMALLRLEMRKMSRLLHGKSNAQIMRMENIKDEGKLAALQILNIMFMNAMIVRPKFAPFIQLKSVEITMKYGLSALASSAFGSYGMLCVGLSKFDESFRYGQLALDLLQKFRSKEYAPRVFAAVYGCITPWQRPIRETLEPLKKAQEIGSQTGDIEFSSLNASLYSGVLFYTEKLPVTSKLIGDVINMMSSRRQDSMLAMMKPYHQLTLCLMGLTTDPTILYGGDLELTESFKHAEETRNATSLVCLRLQTMTLSYLLGDYDVAARMVAEIENMTFPPPGIDSIFCKFFLGMTHLQSARRLKGLPRWTCLSKAKKAIKEFKTWSLHSPHNCLPMKFLLEAELASYQGKDKKAYEKYTASTALAVDAGFRMIEAMSHEHAGRHLYSTGDESLAAASFKKALSSYEDWGAKAKLSRLEKEVHETFAGSSVQFDRQSSL